MWSGLCREGEENVGEKLEGGQVPDVVFSVPEEGTEEEMTAKKACRGIVRLVYCGVVGETRACRLSDRSHFWQAMSAVINRGKKQHFRDADSGLSRWLAIEEVET
jgi:hypothetical protein